MVSSVLLHVFSNMRGSNITVTSWDATQLNKLMISSFIQQCSINLSLLEVDYLDTTTQFEFIITHYNHMQSLCSLSSQLQMVKASDCQGQHFVQAESMQDSIIKALLSPLG